MRAGRAVYPTGGGTVEVLFALNKWVLVKLPTGESVQRRVGEEPELAALLRQLGLTEADAHGAAAAAWRERPATAGLDDARSYESARRAAAIPTWLLVLALAIFCALAVYALGKVFGTPL